MKHYTYLGSSPDFYARIKTCTIHRLDGESLTTLYEKGKEFGLFELFDTDEEIRHFISNNLKDAIRKAICFSKKAPNQYFLNIASCENFCNFEWNKKTYKLLYKQLDLYMPIIRYFMLYGFRGLFEKDCTDGKENQ